MQRTLALTLATFALFGAVAKADNHTPFITTEVAEFREPWALTFLPDGRMLVTEKHGTLHVVTRDGDISDPVSGVPAVEHGGQGGLGDVVLHPEFAENRLVYLSYAEPGSGNTRGAAIARGTLSADDSRLVNVEVIWRAVPAVSGRKHYGHRLVFSDDGYLFVSSGERGKFDPAQDLKSNLGKILRLNHDGTPAKGNPFEVMGGVSAEIWSFGHRNPLGIDIDEDGQLWNVEMGPRGGDELNRVVKGANYGYPIVSNGRHYSGRDIPDHDTRPEFKAPAVWWTPVISPADFMFYSGDEFPEWKGNGLAAGLTAQSLVRIEFDGENAREVERFDMGDRMRAIAQGPNGAIWMLSQGGSLLKLTARAGGSKEDNGGWRTPAPDNLLVMTLPDGEVVIELAPHFAPKVVANIRTLVSEGYFDGLAVLRSHDNYVAQWGDQNFGEEDAKSLGTAAETVKAEFSRPLEGLTVTPVDSRDAYADNVGFSDGFPMAHDGENAWLTHCYGMLGVARGMEPDSGNGTSLYVVTGHAPRHLDKNIALAGRVLSGIEHLSSLPRGTAELGFYETAAEMTRITSIRLGSDLDEPPSVQVMDTSSEEFQQYVEARTTRTNEWFLDKVGRIELCNLHPPVR